MGSFWSTQFPLVNDVCGAQFPLVNDVCGAHVLATEMGINRTIRSCYSGASKHYSFLSGYALSLYIKINSFTTDYLLFY